MEGISIINVVMALVGILGSIVTGLGILVLKRLYNSIGLLFSKYDAQQDEITNIKMFLTFMASKIPNFPPEMVKLLLPVKSKKSNNGDEH